MIKVKTVRNMIFSILITFITEIYANPIADMMIEAIDPGERIEDSLGKVKVVWETDERTLPTILFFSTDSFGYITPDSVGIPIDTLYVGDEDSTHSYYDPLGGWITRYYFTNYNWVRSWGTFYYKCAFWDTSSGYIVNSCVNEVFVTFIDSVPPSPPPIVLSDPSGWTSINSFNVSWTSPGPEYGSPIMGYYFSIDAEPTQNPYFWLTDTVVYNITVSGSGEHLFYVVAMDSAGNIDFDNFATTLLYLDQIPPPLPINILTDNRWTNDLTPWVWNYGVQDAHSGVNHYEYYVEGGYPTTYTFLSPANVDSIELPQSVNAEGELIVNIRAIDNVGNEGSPIEFTEVPIP